MLRRVPTAASRISARLAPRGRHDHYLRALGGIASQRAAGTEGLVIRVGEHAEQATMTAQEQRLIVNGVGSHLSYYLRSRLHLHGGRPYAVHDRGAQRRWALPRWPRVGGAR